jgi:hypothetical protein
MAELTTKARKAIPTSKFAGPDRSYPVQDRSHAANAKARATQMVKAGKLSSSTAAKIKAKANRVLGAKKGLTKVSGPIDTKTLGSMGNSLDFK